MREENRITVHLHIVKGLLDNKTSLVVSCNNTTHYIELQVGAVSKASFLKKPRIVFPFGETNILNFAFVRDNAQIAVASVDLFDPSTPIKAYNERTVNLTSVARPGKGLAKSNLSLVFSFELTLGDQEINLSDLNSTVNISQRFACPFMVNSREANDPLFGSVKDCLGGSSFWMGLVQRDSFAVPPIYDDIVEFMQTKQCETVRPVPSSPRNSMTPTSIAAPNNATMRNAAPQPRLSNTQETSSLYDEERGARSPCATKPMNSGSNHGWNNTPVTRCSTPSSTSIPVHMSSCSFASAESNRSVANRDQMLSTRKKISQICSKMIERLNETAQPKHVNADPTRRMPAEQLDYYALNANPKYADTSDFNSSKNMPTSNKPLCRPGLGVREHKDDTKYEILKRKVKSSGVLETFRTLITKDL